MIKNMKGAIIDIPEGVQNFNNQKPVFEVLIKQGGRVIYHNKAYAVIMNMVQSITKLDLDNGEMEGDSQVLGVGHPIIQFFALHQLEKKMKKIGMVSAAIKMIRLVLKRPELRKQLLDIIKMESIKED